MGKPTHELVVKDVETGDYGKIGVGWMDDKDGYVSIKLNPCVVVSYESLRDKVLTLFPIKTDKEWASFHAKKNRQKAKTESES